MRIVITGGAGFIGLKLAARLLHDGVVTGPEGRKETISKIVLFDRDAPRTLPADLRIEFRDGDITCKADVEAAFAEGASSVFHLAAVVSSAAEADLDLGLAVNLDGTCHVLDACRTLTAPPRFVFASSAAVYGGDPPFHVTDETQAAPRTSYGAQKAMGELLVADYSRRGIVDGRSLRLPTIVVRPGRPNKAASTFASSILREPLTGHPAVCPVTPDTRMAILSPRRLIDAMMAIHDLDAAHLESRRTVALPALSVSIAEMMVGLYRADGQAAVDLVRFQPDTAIQKIVDGWPMSMHSDRSQALGLSADDTIDGVIAAFIEDDLPAQMTLAPASS